MQLPSSHLLDQLTSRDVVALVSCYYALGAQVVARYVGRNQLVLLRTPTDGWWTLKLAAGCEASVRVEREAEALDAYARALQSPLLLRRRSDGALTGTLTVQGRHLHGFLMSWVGSQAWHGLSMLHWELLGRHLAAAQRALAELPPVAAVARVGEPFHKMGIQPRDCHDSDVVSAAKAACRDVELEVGDRLTTGDLCVGRIHGDAQVGNVLLWGSVPMGSPVLLDFEDTRVAPTLTDLATLVWSGWAQGAPMECLRTAARAYGEATGRRHELQELPLFVEAEHVRWLDFVSSNVAQQSARETLLIRGAESLLLLRTLRSEFRTE